MSMEDTNYSHLHSCHMIKALQFSYREENFSCFPKNDYVKKLFLFYCCRLATDSIYTTP